ncbi:MAG: coagulation factor 5/8 type domain-containing protein, partial [Verrucomicrobiota bacterium]
MIFTIKSLAIPLRALRILAVALTLGLSEGKAADYYVDNTGGSDANAGTSAGAAWQTLAKVSATTFQPGDRILFKAGGSWTGRVELKGDGSAGSPIVVNQYGTGNKPLINGGGY